MDTRMWNYFTGLDALTDDTFAVVLHCDDYHVWVASESVDTRPRVQTLPQYKPMPVPGIGYTKERATATGEEEIPSDFMETISFLTNECEHGAVVEFHDGSRYTKRWGLWIPGDVG